MQSPSHHHFHSLKTALKTGLGRRLTVVLAMQNHQHKTQKEVDEVSYDVSALPHVTYGYITQLLCYRKLSFSVLK